ncbi:hypothetical protein [Accumulibacter sp.]|uniref:hypothetical protein n=1 Tax=Accumulibacter sp. TaxID=2053492 RepID=UPI00261307C4|nr:hypothetical protein [Accumulibacter sp.]
MTTLVIVLIALVVLDILVRIWRGGGRAQERGVPQRGESLQPDPVMTARPLLDALDLKSDQLARLVSSQDFGWRFYDYVLDHRSLDQEVLELLARTMPTSNLGKILAHPSASEEARKVAQKRLEEEAARETASSSESDSSSSSDDGYECAVGGPSCCGRGQGPYYH